MFYFFSLCALFSQCATIDAGTISPSGTTFTCGDNFTLCVTVTDYDQVNENWLHGVAISGLPSGSTISPGATPDDLGQGDWVWNSSTPGWFFDDGGFDFGVNCATCNIEFCFDITLPSAPCDDATFSPTIKITGDGTTGGWNDTGCDDDPVTPSNWENIILPIELVDLVAVKMFQHNLVSWTTAQEINNNVQMVERSHNGMSDWEAIGKVSGTNSNKEITYEIVDENPLQTSYYRIHSVDFDGREQFSKVVYLRRDMDDKENTCLIHPNPVKNYLNIEMNSVQNDVIQYTLTDATGKIWESSFWNVNSGSSTQKVDLSQLPNGLYFVSVLGSNIKQTNKILKID